MKYIVLITFIVTLQFSFIAGNKDKVNTPEKTVSGKITTANGEEIAGVKIKIRETNEIFFADLDGNFKMRVKTDKPYSIVLECLGYETRELRSTELNLFSDLNLKEL